MFVVLRVYWIILMDKEVKLVRFLLWLVVEIKNVRLMYLGSLYNNVYLEKIFGDCFLFFV